MLCGKYITTIKSPGCHCTNPFATVTIVDVSEKSINLSDIKVVDLNGTPIIVSGVVTYIIVDSKRAVIDVDNYN